MNFEDRLERAIQRGQHSRATKDREEAAKKLTDDELRSLYSTARLELSERVEECLKKLADHFPGFHYESLMGESGWGAKVTRDDLNFSAGITSRSLYSRLEMVVTPFGSKPIVELVAKGAIRNRELFHRRHYQQLEQLDLSTFCDMVDQWVVEYAEEFAAAE
ncbi:MAG: hypothetical protein R3C01_10230 [Planctomycetaceae bacterium]